MVGGDGEYCEVNVIVIVRMNCKKVIQDDVYIKTGQHPEISVKAEQNSCNYYARLCNLFHRSIMT